MTEMLQSIKADLLSRRLLPVLALLAVVLVAAVGYALGGSSGTSPTPSPSDSGASGSSEASALHVVVASTSANQALAETPGGAHYQSKSATRNPFAPLPSAPEAKSSSAGSTAKSSASSGSSSSSSSASNGSSSSGSSSSGSSGSGSSGGSAPTPAPKSSKPSKPKVVSTVTVLFGLAPAAPTPSTTLTTYANLKPQAQLPSKQDARLLFERVSTSGKGAIFKFVLPPILRGQGQCLPSTSECEALDLAVGQTEELEYVEASGQTVLYQLKLVSIAVNDANATAARASQHKAASVARVISARIAPQSASNAHFDTSG